MLVSKITLFSVPSKYSESNGAFKTARAQLTHVKRTSGGAGNTPSLRVVVQALCFSPLGLKVWLRRVWPGCCAVFVRAGPRPCPTHVPSLHSPGRFFPGKEVFPVQRTRRLPCRRIWLRCRRLAVFTPLCRPPNTSRGVILPLLEHTGACTGDPRDSYRYWVLHLCN